MKKIFIIAVMLGLVFAYSSNVYAVEPPTYQVGIVQGLVSGPDNNPLISATINVDCNGVTKNTTSDSVGFYSVQYSNEGCTVGQSVNVSAIKDSQTGNATGTMQDAGTVGFLKLDVAVVHVPVVPEFGLITGGMALLTSAGSYFFLKRKAA